MNIEDDIFKWHDVDDGVPNDIIQDVFMPDVLVWVYDKTEDIGYCDFGYWNYVDRCWVDQYNIRKLETEDVKVTYWCFVSLGGNSKRRPG